MYYVFSPRLVLTSRACVLNSTHLTASHRKPHRLIIINRLLFELLGLFAAARPSSHPISRSSLLVVNRFFLTFLSLLRAQRSCWRGWSARQNSASWVGPPSPRPPPSNRRSLHPETPAAPPVLPPPPPPLPPHLRPQAAGRDGPPAPPLRPLSATRTAGAPGGGRWTLLTRPSAWPCPPPRSATPPWWWWGGRPAPPPSHRTERDQLARPCCVKSSRQRGLWEMVFLQRFKSQDFRCRSEVDL